MKKIILPILALTLIAMLIASSIFFKKEVYTCTLNITPALFEEERTLERYDVRDLLTDFTTGWSFTPPNTSKKTVIQKVVSYYTDLKEIIIMPFKDEPITSKNIDALIRHTICTEAWGDKYGSSIIITNGSLLITTYAPVHKEIEKFLIFLKKANP